MIAAQLELLAFTVLGYLIGSIPFSQLISRWRSGADLRFDGYRNVGAYNVVRTTGMKWGLMAGLLDAGKGMAILFIVDKVGGTHFIKLLAGLCAILGHNYPVWLGFKGGKGVMVAVGLLFWIVPLETMIAVIVGFMVFRIVHFVNVSVSAGFMVFIGLMYMLNRFSEIRWLLLGIFGLIGLAYLPRFIRWLSIKMTDLSVPGE